MLFVREQNVTLSGYKVTKSLEIVRAKGTNNVVGVALQSATHKPAVTAKLYNSVATV